MNKEDFMGHIPVLFETTEKILQKYEFNTFLDCTFGAGGHSNLFAKFGHVIAIDRDPTVKGFVGENIEFHNDRFSNFDKYVKSVDLIYADLGISTMQIESDRGFSFMTNSSLDMNMENGDKLKNIIKRMPIYKIKEIIEDYGEEPQASKIAYNIERFRLKKDIETTFDLREAIGIDKFPVLARVFQAFRIFLNQEMQELEILLKKIHLYTQNAFIITFHSLEDRLVKHAFRKNFRYNGFLTPTPEEIQKNPKSRSAKLRFGSNLFDIKI